MISPRNAGFLWELRRAVLVQGSAGRIRRNDTQCSGAEG